MRGDTRIIDKYAINMIGPFATFLSIKVPSEFHRKALKVQQEFIQSVLDGWKKQVDPSLPEDRTKAIDKMVADITYVNKSISQLKLLTKIKKTLDQLDQ